MTDPVNPMTCDHPSFAVQATVDRVAMPAPEGAVPRIGAYRLQVAAHCETCGTPFWFPGLPTGVSFSEPVTGTDGFQATLPLVPANRRLDVDPSLVSTIVRTQDIHKGRR